MKTRMTFSKKDLVVVLGIVLLVIMNIGAINSTGRRRAKEMVCLSNLRKWGTMFEMFTNENNGYFNTGDTDYMGGWVGGTGLWMNALRPYYKNNSALLLCPEAPSRANNFSGTFTAWRRDELDGSSQSTVGSYGINSWTNNMTNNRGVRLEEWSWKNVRNISNKNNIPLLLDSTWYGAWPTYTDSPPLYNGELAMGTYNEMKHFCINRHNGGVNVLFMDWSTRKIGLKELWTLKWHRSFYTGGPYTRAGGVWDSDWPSWMRNFKEY